MSLPTGHAFGASETHPATATLWKQIEAREFGRANKFRGFPRRNKQEFALCSPQTREKLRGRNKIQKKLSSSNRRTATEWPPMLNQEIRNREGGRHDRLALCRAVRRILRARGPQNVSDGLFSEHSPGRHKMPARPSSCSTNEKIGSRSPPLPQSLGPRPAEMCKFLTSGPSGQQVH